MGRKQMEIFGGFGRTTDSNPVGPHGFKIYPIPNLVLFHKAVDS